MFNSGNLTVMSDKFDDESDSVIRKLVSSKKNNLMKMLELHQNLPIGLR